MNLQAQSVLITENFQQKDLHLVLKELDTKYGLKFAYDDELVKGFPVTANLERVNVESLMKMILAGSGLTYKFSGETILILPGEKESIVARKINIFGIVIDRNTGEPLPYANLFLSGKGGALASNADGKFHIKEISDTTRLEIYYLGYLKKSIDLTLIGEGSLMIEMENEAEELEEVVVLSDRSKSLELSEGVSRISFNPDKISVLPSLGEFDVFRTLQLLPGISGTDETSSGLAIRGSTPDQNLVLYDGFTLYHIDHFYGVYSAFNSDAIKNIQLYKGGFDARYGGRASSVIDITGKSGSLKPSLGVGINLIGVNAVAEAPIGDKVRVLAAFRRSYTDIIQSNLYKDLFDNVVSSSIDDITENFPQFDDIEPVFYFYDLNTKITYNPSQKDVLAFSFYNSKYNLFYQSRELLNDNLFTELEEETTWGNTGGSLRWARQWNTGFYSNLYVARSNYFSDTRIGQNFGLLIPDTLVSSTIEQNNDVKDLTVKLDNEYLIGNNSGIEFGALFTRNDVLLSSRFADQTFQALDQTGQQYAFYVQHNWTPTTKLEINLGLRSNYFDLNDKNYWEPRASVQYKVTDKLMLKTAAGLNHQFINRIVRQELFQSNPDFWIISEDLPEVEARQYVLGVQYENDHFLFDVEAYYKFSDGIIEYIPRLSNFQQATQVSQNLYRIGDNTTRGIDILLEKKKGKYTGWIAYTLSQSDNRFQGLNNNESFPSRLDQRHEFKVVNMLSIGKWDLALNWVYGSGKPYSVPSGTYTLTFLDSAKQEFAAIDNFNGNRLPDYHRMDFSATFNFSIGKGKAQTGLSIFNLYGRENIKFRRFTRVNFDEGTDQILEVPKFVVNDVKLLGFTPNLFFRYML